MFTRIFKSDYMYQLAFIVFAAVIIWIRSLLFLTPLCNAPEISPLYAILLKVITNNSIILVILAFTLLFIQSLEIKRAFSTNELINRKDLLVTFIYLLMMSSSTELYTIHPILFANLFLIFSLQYILGIYGKPDSFESVFNASILISIASLFYFPSIYFIIFIWLSFIIYRLYAWREWVVSLIGLSIPYLYLFSYYYVTDQLKAKCLTYIEFFKNNHRTTFHPDEGNYIFFTVIGLMSTYIIFNILNRLTEKSIYYRKKVLVLSMFLLMSFLTLIFSGKYFTYHLSIVFIPLSFFFSTHIQQIKRMVISELFFIILIIAMVLNILL